MIVNTALVIRKPVEEVFRAFVDPAVTTRFWFTKSSGPLEPGATVSWEWEMFGVGTKVAVKDVVENERIRVEWNPDDPSTVEWTFTPHERGTHVRIVEDDIKGDTSDGRAAHALDSMQGFSLVLAGAKAWLEHGIELNLVADHG
ncbi:SRPBCC family protein [Virgisporangium ochraceum]|uniref:Activator of HSP90 ATPase n=1 Tax=Virgisporangium ochraceum TaxID=65505 RepID=A0A8J4EH31_9ACTN|nr:SRPBCC family protein [Virgisporangium ochraceum]GIJ74293.1 activator of HSP90 ATPase [Virgisporangium ochraceum]